MGAKIHLINYLIDLKFDLKFWTLLQEIKSYERIEDYINDWLPKVEEKLKSQGDEYLTNLYYHDITASILTNGFVFE